VKPIVRHTSFLTKKSWGLLASTVVPLVILPTLSTREDSVSSTCVYELLHSRVIELIGHGYLNDLHKCNVVNSEILCRKDVGVLKTLHF
jgi:hypothetical protein